MKKSTKTINQRELASKIADDLFANEAVRLVLRNSYEKDQGGWCKSAVVERIVTILNANEK